MLLPGPHSIDVEMPALDWEEHSKISNNTRLKPNRFILNHNLSERRSFQPDVVSYLTVHIVLNLLYTTSHAIKSVPLVRLPELRIVLLLWPDERSVQLQHYIFTVLLYTVTKRASFLYAVLTIRFSALLNYAQGFGKIEL